MWAVLYLCVTLCESIQFGTILKAFGAYMPFSAVKLNACHTTGCEAQQNVAQCSSLKERDRSPVHMADCIAKRGEARRRCMGWCADSPGLHKQLDKMCQFFRNNNKTIGMILGDLN